MFWRLTRSQTLLQELTRIYSSQNQWGGALVCMYVPLKSDVEILELVVIGSGAFGRSLGHESGTLVDGNSTLWKTPLGDPQPLLPGEDTARGHWLSGRALLQRTQPPQCLDVGLPRVSPRSYTEVEVQIACCRLHCPINGKAQNQTQLPDSTDPCTIKPDHCIEWKWFLLHFGSWKRWRQSTSRGRIEIEGEREC